MTAARKTWLPEQLEVQERICGAARMADIEHGRDQPDSHA